MQDDVVAEVECLLQRIAVHRAAADCGKSVRRAVEVDVAGHDAGVIVRKRAPIALVHRIAHVGCYQQRDRGGRAAMELPTATGA